MSKMATNRRKEDVDGFDWRRSNAKKLLVQGLEDGSINNTMPPGEIFDKYNLDYPQDFQFVGFRLFQNRLKRLQQKEEDKESCAERDAAALAHDREIYPFTEYNEQGEPIWRKTSAIRQLLQQDINDNKHIHMTPAELWESREEYQKTDLTTFRNHIYSSIKSAKFTKYCEDKRSTTKP